MHICLRLDRTALRGWQVELIRRLLGRPGCTVAVEHHPAPAAALPANAERLFRFERLVHGRGGADWGAPAPGGLDGLPLRPGTPDRVIDLSGSQSPPGAWHLLFDGSPGDRALFATLVAGGSPIAELRDGDRVVAAGRLGTEAPGNVRASFSDALARTVTLIEAALDGAPADRPMPAAALARKHFGVPALGAAVARKLARAVGRRVHRLKHPEPNWRVGWRRLDGPDLFDLRRHPDGGWTDLPDDGRRFYADPFPIEIDGQVTLFVEEYPHATAKGIVSAVSFGPAGPEGAPVPVLELPYHLSYPYVFARDGAVWMVPEGSAAGRIELFRATRFPGGWVREAVLIEGVVAADSTLLEHGGRWWLFATVRGDGGSSSDALHLWFAPDFRGPWTPHPLNPVLIDAASARPAGRVVERDGDLWRPVQDCRGAYGAALGLARVLTLDEGRFAQRVETILRPGPSWPGHLLHTVNRAGPYEFIDGSGNIR